MPRAEPRFDAVVTVDWSAAAKPTTGADSIWLAAVGRDGWAGLVNPPTRGAAMAMLRLWLARCLERRQRVLVACDFPLGFPRGTAQALGLTGGEGAWLALWRRLARDLVDDDATNHNNRFAVASAWNAALGPAFWGCPPAAAGTHLNPRKPAHRPLPDRRLVEERMPTAQSVWKLYTTGSVGSQALTGMARLLALKDYFGNNLSVWPFETSWSAGTTPVVVAEMYPSLHPAEVLPGLPRDAGQAVAMARWLIDADPAVFQGEPGLQPAEDAAVRQEEGWVLGVSGPQTAVRSAPAAPPPTDPAEIYRQSWSMVRAVTDLSHLPAELHPVARRLVHSQADPEVIATLAASPGAVTAARAALAAGAAVLCDAQMVAHGIIASRLPSGTQLLCTLDHPDLATRAAAAGTTRSALAVEAWVPHLAGAVVVIGNAPTALMRLLAVIDQGAPRPAVVLGFCVGFVGATEAKEALMRRNDLAWIALGGRRGGSALAAAAVNALAPGGEPA